MCPRLRPNSCYSIYLTTWTLLAKLARGGGKPEPARDVEEAETRLGDAESVVDVSRTGALKIVKVEFIELGLSGLALVGVLIPCMAAA